MSKVKFELRGLKQVQDYVQSMIDAAEKSKVVGEFALEVKDKLVDSIERGTLHVKGPGKEWANKKKRLGLDPRTLIATHNYVESIFVRQVPKGFVLGVPLRLGKLAGWLEFGTRTMPARPHWRTVMRWAAQRWELIPKKFGEDVMK